MSLGERFRASREARGLTLSEVSEHLRIRSVYLAAIEDENWSAIGAAVYARGFLRTYARYLGLEPEQAVAEYNEIAGSRAEAPSASPIGVGGAYRQPRGLAPILWIASIVALALIGFVVYLYVSPPRAAQTSAQASPGQARSSAPGAAAPAAMQRTSAPSPAPKRTLAIHLTAPSWLRVSVDGNVSIEGTFPAGTSKTFHGKRAVVRVGNAGGVRIIVDGKTVRALGGPGDVAERTYEL